MKIGMVGLILFSCSGDNPATEESKENPLEEPLVLSKEPDQTGEQLYQQYCSSCHMVNGAGMIGRAPPLAGSEWVEMDASVSIRIVLYGLQGEIEVKGQKFMGIMASWGAILSDEKVSSILTYTRSNWGNDAPPVSPADVAKIREEFKGHGAWKASELK